MGKPGKGGGGNSHQRAVQKASEPPVVPPALPIVPPEGGTPPEKSRGLRLIEFLEHQWFLWPLGVVAAAVGLLYYTPAFVVLMACFSGAFHRTRVVSGLSWKIQIPSYLGIVAASVLIAWLAITVARTAAKDLVREIVAGLAKATGKETTPVSPDLPTIGFQDDSDMVEASFGTLTGGNHIAMLKQMNGQAVYPIDYNGIKPLQFEYVDGKVSYSVKFWSPNQQSPVEVTDGKFTMRNDSLDRNYSSRALEVVTRDGHPILQIIWLTPGHMRLNGLFPLPDGNLLCMSDSGPKTVSPNAPLVECNIQPIFKYPSWKYQGELASSSPLPTLTAPRPPVPARKEPPRFSLDSLSVTISFPQLAPGATTNTALAQFHVIATNAGDSPAHGWRIQIAMMDQTGMRFVLGQREVKGEVPDDTEPGRSQVFANNYPVVIPAGCGPQIIRVWMKYEDALNPNHDPSPQVFYRRWGGWNNRDSVTEVDAKDVKDVKPIEAMFARDFPMPQ
jgi:hypothetical protein